MHLLPKLNHAKSMKHIWSIKFKQANNYKDSKYAFHFGIHIISNHGQESCSRYSDSLWTERSRDQIALASRFPHLSRKAHGSTQPPAKWAPGLFPGDKAAGAWR
jgi:hypothetical protein